EHLRHLEGGGAQPAAGGGAQGYRQVLRLVGCARWPRPRDASVLSYTSSRTRLASASPRVSTEGKSRCTCAPGFPGRLRKWISPPRRCTARIAMARPKPPRIVLGRPPRAARFARSAGGKPGP